MLVTIPDVLSKNEWMEIRAELQKADWIDGRITAGHQSALTKDNSQIPQDHPVAQRWGNYIVQSLEKNLLFLSSALPLKVFPPLFNCYKEGQSFGTHVDNAIRSVPGTSHRIRTDLSATLFLTEPSEYEGGELTIEDLYGVHRVKCPAGHMVLYPASSLHHVTPVTKGARIAAFFWIQSLVRQDQHRTLLFDLDLGIQQVNRDNPGHPASVQLTGVYHNLLRLWAEL